MSQKHIEDADYRKLVELIEQLQNRITRLEHYIGLELGNGSSVAPREPLDKAGNQLEMKVGEYGLAWAGSAILFLGIIFSMIFAHSKGHALIANILGYAAAAALYVMSRLWRNTISHLSRLMAAGTTILLFYSTLRLHFYTVNPFIADSSIAVALLIGVVILQFYFAESFKSAVFGILGVLLGVLTALLADDPFVTLSLLILVSAAAVFFFVQRSWTYLPAVAMLFVYASHWIWLLNNPVAGHEIKMTSDSQYNLVYLFLCASIFNWPIIFSKKVGVTQPFAIATLIFNCLLFSMLTVLAAFLYWPANSALILMILAIFFLACSFLQWLNTHQQLPAAVLASFAFLALSFSIARSQSFPIAFFWLSLQSLLVLSIALWFRSKTLVVVNTLIYSIILLLYLIVSPSSHLVNFTFGFLALVSARILNWQKDRLTLHTGFLRNLYLAIAFFLILYALYKAVPRHYVTLSWTASAVGYFFISYLLNNVKYRWMGTLALIVTVFYLLLVDLPRLDMTYRILAFLFLGVMTLAISLFYTRIRRLLTRTGSSG